MKDRREFIKLSLATIATLAIPSSLFATTFDDYKALVVVFNAGGNDGMNMFIPSGGDVKTGYENYAKARENIKVSNNNLNLPLDVLGVLDLESQVNPYELNDDLSDSYTKGFYEHSGMDVATNALMPEIAYLINKGKVAVVANCGNIIEPAKKEELISLTKPKPPFLFAHNHQTKLAMSGQASVLNTTGWAGRVYDMWKDVNGGDIYGMNIALGNTAHLFYGEKTSSIQIKPSGPIKYKNINRNMYDNLLAQGETNNFRNLYKNLRKYSLDMQDTVVDDWNNNTFTFTSKNSYGGVLFSNPSNVELSQVSPTLTDTSILKNLEGVAKLAYIGKNRGLKRQIFFVQDGGYDTHSNQTKQHARKLRGLSLGVGDFYKALEDMGMENEVTTFTYSDFGRSVGENGDGTDHGWGNNFFAIGGAVNGGFYGTLPDLTLGGENDISKKGRIIPSTSITQYYATLLKWFGADDESLIALLPELNNFEMKDLGFMR